MSNDMPEEIYVDLDLSTEDETCKYFAGDSKINERFGTKYIRADKVIPEGYALVPIERIDGLKEAIIYFEHDGHDKEIPYAITLDDKMSLMLKAARAYLKLQRKNKK